MSAEIHKVDIPYGAKDWVHRLARKEMPALAHSVQHLKGLAGSHDASVAELVKVVLEDPNLTARIIRISNSAHYNKSGARTNTISRAISLIGFESIRSLCISSKVIDALLRDAPNDRLLQVVAQSFHSAMQAKSLLSSKKSAVQEEAFIAALMYQIGEASFWCYGGDAAAIVDAKLRIPGAVKNDVVEEVIGAKFRHLTYGLAKAWRLGDMLVCGLKNEAQVLGAVEVRLGHEISVASSEGWDTPKVAKLVKKVAKLKGLNEEEALKQVIACADKTVAMAREWGAEQIESLIPSSVNLASSVRASELEQTVSEDIVEDQALQLSILRELAAMANGKADLNLVFNMVLEGMHRGVGLDRALLAFKTKGNKGVLGKYVLGDQSDRMGKRFNFPVSNGNVFEFIFEGSSPYWFGEKGGLLTKSMLNAEIKAAIGDGDFFIAPISVRGRSIGLFYADCRVSERPLNSEQFAAFCHFVQQTNLILSMQ